MKKTCLIFCVLAAPFFMKAQMLTPTVISSTGGFSSNANGSLSYTVGEMTMVQTFSANGNILTQGFQQPTDTNFLGLLDLTQSDFGSFVVYPNPAVDITSFGFQLPEAGRVSISLYNDLGQKVSDVYNSNYENGKTVQQTDVSRFASGIYFMTMTFTAAKDQQTHIITQKLQILK
ncbi:MAG: hypothetical protein JWO06_1916 [Bacteroidota bacterium]|nr:hypothetical protein [Bacteroidota bacterium]